MASAWAGHPLKRLLDAAAALAALLLLAPLLIALALLVRLRLGSPVLFRQTRPGKDGRLFTLHKFRSMREGPEPDGERLTAFGRFLRRSSLDELPELWNVLRGDMSLVGPRPLLPDYLDRYSPEQARRHEVRPGLTGWAQVHGRNAVDWTRKFELDVHYVDHATPWMDAKILLLTLAHIFRPGRGTDIPEEFRG